MKRELICAWASVLWLAGVLAVAEPAGDEGSVVPIRFSDRTTPNIGALATPGFQGDIVEARTLTVASDSGCKTDLISPSVLYAWCADDDGCSVRLITRLGVSNMTVPQLPATLVAQSDTGAWFLRTVEIAGVQDREGNMGNFFEEKLLWLALDAGTGTYNACFLFDAPSAVAGGGLTARGFGLRACESNGVSAVCSVRIDD